MPAGAELVAALAGCAVFLLFPVSGRPVRTRGAPRVTDPVDPALVLDLLATAVEAGADLPRALATVGAALGSGGESLRRVAAALLLGAEWTAAWSDVPPAMSPAKTALEPAWTTGASAAPALRSAAVEERQARRRRAREATSKLGVRLVLPLGLCFLPAFVLIGVVPVLISLAGRLTG